MEELPIDLLKQISYTKMFQVKPSYKPYEDKYDELTI